MVTRMTVALEVGEKGRKDAAHHWTFGPNLGDTLQPHEVAALARAWAAADFRFSVHPMHPGKLWPGRLGEDVY